MIDRDFGIRREIKAVELIGEQEYPPLHTVQLQIGFHQLFVELVFLMAVLLRVISHIPGHNLAFETLRAGILPDRIVILHGILLGLGKQFIQESIDRLRVFSHPIGQHVIGVRRVPQQIGDLQTQIDHPLDVLRIVELTAQAEGVAGSPKLLLQLAVGRILHERDVTRRLKRHRPSLLATGLGFGGHTVPHEIGKLGHLRRIRDIDRKGIRGSQHIAAEPERKLRKFGRILPVQLLVLVGKIRTAAHETVIDFLQQFLILFRKEPSRMFIDGLHTLEELRVERYVVGQGRQFGLYVLGHLLHLGRSIRFEQVEKNTFDPRKQPALTIERHDRIIEGRLGWIVYDRVDFGTRHSDRGIERRFVIGHPDPVERRGFVRRIPLREQGVVRINFRQLGNGHRMVRASGCQSG